MALFSWFMSRTSVNSAKNNQATLERELSTFNNNTMWPTAKVRGNILIQQQKFVTAASHTKKETKIKVLKEYIN